MGDLARVQWNSSKVAGGAHVKDLKRPKRYQMLNGAGGRRQMSMSKSRYRRRQNWIDRRGGEAGCTFCTARSEQSLAPPRSADWNSPGVR